MGAHEVLRGGDPHGDVGRSCDDLGVSSIILKRLSSMEPPQCRSRLRRDRDHVDLAVVSASFESILNECHFRAVQPPGEAAIGPETSHQLALLPGSVSCGHFLSLRRGGSQRSRAPIQMRAPAANGEEMK